MLYSLKAENEGDLKSAEITFKDRSCYGIEDERLIVTRLMPVGLTSLL